MLDRTHAEECGTREGKRSGRWEKVNKKIRNWDGSFLHERHVAEFLNYYILHGCLWVVRYMRMCTCIILIVNLPAE